MIQQKTLITLLAALVVFAVNSRQYEVGVTYQYGYSSQVLFNEPKATKLARAVGHQVAASVDLTPVWQDPSDPSNFLMQLKVSSPKLSVPSESSKDFTEKQSSLDSDNGAPIYFSWNNGKIGAIYASDSESPSLLNLKKGVAGLFQVQDASGQAEEMDASGLCEVEYQLHDATSLIKKKYKCQSQGNSFSRSQKLLGVSTASDFHCDYNLRQNSKIVDKLTATESHVLHVNLLPQAGASAHSNQALHLTSEFQSTAGVQSSVTEVLESAAKVTGASYVEGTLQLVEEPIPCEGFSCKTLTKAVNELKKNLQSSECAKSTAASAFVSLVPILRRSPKNEIMDILRSNKNKNIKPQLIDVLAAAQIDEGHEIATKVIKFESDLDLAERYLVSVSLSTQPSERLLTDLLSLCQSKISNVKLLESATLALAAVTKTFLSNCKGDVKPIVSEVRGHLLNGLSSCPEDKCRQLYLRSLKNLAMADTLTVIMHHIESSDRKTSVAAIKALKALPASIFDDDLKAELAKIYFQTVHQYDSSTRTLALDALLEHGPSTEFLFGALRLITSKKAKELSTYTVQRLVEFAGNSETIREQLKGILASNPWLNNYHVLAQDGFSTAFSRLLYRHESNNGSFSSSTEAAGGMMKRSSFDIHLSNADDSMHVLSFGLFAGGLSAFGSGSSEEPDDEDANAGMEVTLAGAQLRPLIFFEGQGELMGHVWSGTASERTSALQATILLQDHRQAIALQSGFVTVFSMLGSVSFDFGGEIQISLWNRNSHSVVDNRAAWEMDGSLSLATSFVKSAVNFKVGAESVIDFTSDVSFASGLLACLRMGQQEFNLNYTVQMLESVPGTKYGVHERKKRSTVVPGRTYALNSKNSALCNELFAQ